MVILGHHVWQDRYGGDRGIIGRTVRVDEVPMMVIGVMPPRKRFPEDTDLWTQLTPSGDVETRTRTLLMFGRLADGVNVAAAGAR